LAAETPSGPPCPPFAGLGAAFVVGRSMPRAIFQDLGRGRGAAVGGEIQRQIEVNLNNHLAVCQNLVPLVNIKIAGKWMFIPLKMVLIGIDPYP